MSGIVGLAGTWVLRKKGSDYLPELEEIEGIPPLATLIDTKAQFVINQRTDYYDEVHISLRFLKSGM